MVVVLSILHRFVNDCQEVTGKNAMKEQVDSFLRAIPKVKSGNLISGWLNGSLPVAIGGIGELPPMFIFMNCFPKPIKTCFIHDMESREILNRFVKELNVILSIIDYCKTINVQTLRRDVK